MSEIPKAYEPARVEQKWYSFWMEHSYFTPKIDHKKKPFVIIMPPPNVTGELHLGHALTATLEDCLIRWHRMRGDPTLWLPGVDPAVIATQHMRLGTSCDWQREVFTMDDGPQRAVRTTFVKLYNDGLIYRGKR